MKKVIKRDLGKAKECVTIIPFSDCHIGSSKCNYELIRRQVNRVLKEKNTYAVLLGDLINNTTKLSVGDVYSEPMSPMEQIKVAVDIFAPIKDKILAVTAGNHERRTYKTDGCDLIHFFCAELGILDRYDYCAPVLLLKMGCKTSEHAGNQFVYSIYMTHGDGQGGRTTGGKANGLERRGKVTNADIVITGHTHQPISFRTSTFEICKTSGTIVERETVFVNCASMLNYEQYAELFGLPPSSVTQPEIVLDWRKPNIVVKI